MLGLRIFASNLAQLYAKIGAMLRQTLPSVIFYPMALRRLSAEQGLERTARFPAIGAEVALVGGQDAAVAQGFGKQH